MHSTLRSLALAAALALSPALAHAGWVIDWTTTASNQKGVAMPSQQATQSISTDHVRMDQPEVITIIDYSKDQMVMMNPNKQYFWSGSTDDYVHEMTRTRDAAMRDRVGSMTGKPVKPDAPAESTPRTIDESKLPPVSITSAGTKEKIAGYEAEKYDVKVNGELFEELWIAPLDLSADINYDRFIAQQLKNSAAMMGKSADSYNAVYRNPEYRRLTEKATVLKSVTHHLAGTFDRTATSVQQKDVPASAFTVPDAYRKVRLSDLLEPPPAAPPADKNAPLVMPTAHPLPKKPKT